MRWAQAHIAIRQCSILSAPCAVSARLICSLHVGASHSWVGKLVRAGNAAPAAVHLQVNYINAHATSTLVGDKAEVKAIRKVRSPGLAWQNAAREAQCHGRLDERPDRRWGMARRCAGSRLLVPPGLP